MTVGSLFSGIGGLDLGLHWAGFETKWFCEIEKFPQAVLRKHWPHVPIIEDVRNVTTGNVQRVDVIAGGFPCQDISWAGKGRGIDYDLSEQEGTRSGLWWEMWRVIRDLRPRYVIAENVPALTHRGLDIVLGSLAEIGYDAEWQTISAASVGAPHIRERVFIVAYENSNSIRFDDSLERQETLQQPCGRGPEGARRRMGKVCLPDWFAGDIGQPWPVSFKVDVSYAEGIHVQGREGGQGQGEYRGGGDEVGNTPLVDVEGNGEGAVESEADSGERGGEHRGTGGRSGNWVEVEYDFRGVAHGVSDRVGALKGYGNAVVPQVGYLVGRAVREHAEENGWWTA